MGNIQSLSHPNMEYTYHITWIPKYRKKKVMKSLENIVLQQFRFMTECGVMM